MGIPIPRFNLEGDCDIHITGHVQEPLLFSALSSLEANGFITLSINSLELDVPHALVQRNDLKFFVCFLSSLQLKYVMQLAYPGQRIILHSQKQTECKQACLFNGLVKSYYRVARQHSESKRNKFLSEYRFSVAGIVLHLKNFPRFHVAVGPGSADLPDMLESQLTSDDSDDSSSLLDSQSGKHQATKVRVPNMFGDIGFGNPTGPPQPVVYAGMNPRFVSQGERIGTVWTGAIHDPTTDREFASKNASKDASDKSAPPEPPSEASGETSS